MSNSRASSLIENSVRSVSSIHMVGWTRFYMGSSGMGEAEELSKVYHDVAERSSKLLGEFAQKQAQGMSSAVRDEMGIAKAFMDLYTHMRSEEHTSELQSLAYLVCRLLLEKKKTNNN